MAQKIVVETSTLHYPKGLINPEDLINFVPFSGFDRRWKELGLNDKDLEALKVFIMMGPKINPIVRRTGGLRKMRFAPPGWNIGKRGAIRVGYAYSEYDSIVLLVTVYAKPGKDSLTAAECAAIKKMLKLAWERVR